MKLVKKILRLLPLIVYIIALFGYISYFKENVNLDYETINLWWIGLSDNFYMAFYDICENTMFASLGTWFEVNISTNGFFIFSLSTMVYELFLSLIFLMFDFINMIFSWANKLVNKGGNLDD